MNYDVAKIFSKLILSDKKLKIKLLGDSITHGVGGTGWAQNGEPIVANFSRSPSSYCWATLMRDHLESQYNCTVVNNGCTGTKIEFILQHFDTLVNKDDDIIVCTIGTNNRHQYFKEGEKKTVTEHSEIFYSNIKKLDEKFKSTGKDYIFVANIPAAAANEFDGADYWRIIHMNDIRDLYTKAHFECGFPFIDLYTLFLTYCDTNGISYETLLKDGLHPNDAGYEVMFKLLLREFGLAEKAYGEQ